MKSLPLLVLIALLLSPARLTAQVVARQGSATNSPFQEFKSPMVLDLPLKNFREMPFGTGKDFKEVQKYYCEDLSISQLLVDKREDAQRGKPSGLRLNIHGAVSVRPSYDRLATLRFDVVKGEERFATNQVFNVNAEEGQTHSFTTSLKIAAEDLDRLFAEGEAPLLRITVTVQDNK